MIVGMIEGVTRVLGKAQGYFGLPIRDEVMTDSTNGRHVPTMTSAWFPTPKELEALNAGKAVYLNLFGDMHPPVMLYVGDGAEPQEDNSSATLDEINRFAGALAKLEFALIEWDQLRKRFADNGSIVRSSDILLKQAIETYFAEKSSS